MTISLAIAELKQKIRTLESEYHRTPSSVQLLAVSKSRSIAEIQEAIQAGLTHFGENYYQEAITKINALKAFPIDWHFIGSIQNNKAKYIAQNFSWVHSLSHLKTAAILNQARPKHLQPLNVCIQINIDQENTKSGIDKSNLLTFTQSILKFPALSLRGLMVVPKAKKNSEQQFQTFFHTAQLLTQLNETLHLSLDTLSMGMSDDLAEAIKAGSTWVRVGRGIFGERIPTC